MACAGTSSVGQFFAFAASALYALAMAISLLAQVKRATLDSVCVCVSVCRLSVSLSVCRSRCLSVSLSLCLSVSLPLCLLSLQAHCCPVSSLASTPRGLPVSLSARSKLASSTEKKTTCLLRM
eukprot:COSAG02_NODE_3760_length_6272_cov_13.055565_5_plen_123_part_00